MDAATRVFLLMIVVAVLGGLAVVTIKSDFRVEQIYRSNSNYYPAVNDKSLRKSGK
jgi:hypothetical protein